MSTNEFLDDFNIKTLAREICKRAKARRLELNLTQAALAKRSGVSLGTLKHFERFGEISLKHLLMLAIILQSTDEFKKLFSNKNYQSIEEVINTEKVKNRKRGRLND
jgi:transcriptional regulator with XRE-family HTH domain